jgi:hypothetical protein
MSKGTEKKGFDLAAMSAAMATDEGVWVDILHPASTEKIGLRIKVAGVDSRHYREAVKALQDRDIALRERRGRLDMSADEIDRRAIGIVGASTLDWAWDDCDWGGEKLAFTPENVRRVYTEARWIYDQIDRAIQDRALFLKR